MFKIGDKVICIDGNGTREDKGAGWARDRIFKIEGINMYGKYCGIENVYFENKNGLGVYEGLLKLYIPAEQNKAGKQIMKTLNNFIKKILDKETQSLMKVEYLNGDLELTEKGKQQLMSILFLANKEELVELANEEIKEAEDK